MTTLNFIKSGIQTLIQDLGRTEHRGNGVPVGGAMDKSSAILANQLVGNDSNSPIIEATIQGPKIQFIGEACHIAITGADISPKLNAIPIEMNQVVFVPENSILEFGRLNSGCRTYIAVHGEWQVPSWLGSVSAIFPNGPDFTPLSFISKGSEVMIKHHPEDSGPNSKKGSLATTARQNLNNIQVIRVTAGPEVTSFSQADFYRFFGRTHTISPASNRWGYRLDGEIHTIESKEEIISSGVFPGVIQVPPSGTPIILMADAQTVGGYPRIAIVVSEDMDKLAQIKPGDSLRFEIT